MPSTLSIYLPIISDEHADLNCFWVISGDDGKVSEGFGELIHQKEYWAEAVYTKIRVFIPGELVFRSRKEVPTRSRKTALQALPFLLEQEVAANIENSHIAFDFIDAKSSMVAISTIDKMTLELIISIMARVGIDPDHIYPDTALINETEVLKVEDRILMSSGEEFPIVLPANIYDVISAQQKKALPQLFRLCTKAVIEVEPDTGLLHFSDFLIREINEVNLRQGDFIRNSNTNKSTEFALRLASGLMISAFFVVIYWVAMGWQFNQESILAKAESERQYRALFPNEKRVFNIRKQMQGHLQRGTGKSQGNDFIEMYNFASSQLSQNQNVVLRQLRYQQENQSLQLEVQATDLEMVNQLTKLLSEHEKFTSNLTSANSNSDGVIARIRIYSL